MTLFSKLSNSFTNNLKVTLSIFVGIGAISLAYFKYVSFTKYDNYVDVLEELNHSYVNIKNREIIEHKLKKIIGDGKSKLLIVADFDRTISKFKENGKIIPTSHGVLEDTTHLSESFVSECCGLKKVYYPIEIDPNRTVAEKIPFIVEWYSKVHDLIVKYGFSKQLLTTVVGDSPIKLREGFDHLVKNSKKKHVPLLIFSAGLGDIIVSILTRDGLLRDNVKVVSNALNYNRFDIATDFQHDIIHPFNKNINFLKTSGHYDLITKRPNVILLGDSISDTHMIEDIEASTVLRIGFLNEVNDEKLINYSKVYDIVIIQNESMDVVNSILSSIE